ncbi:N-acetylmuramoyl-L-alanine amidase [bacterium]|nr:N-acetylmuramoyl-L-alanine amidase [bacterium]
MRKLILLTVFVFLAVSVISSEPPDGIREGTVTAPPSIHEIELEEHARMPEMVEPGYPLDYSLKRDEWEAQAASKATKALTKTVYGFMPYWVVTSLTHVRWDLLSHVAYFSAEMDSAGGITALHNWPSGTYVQALLNTAQANGVAVTLTATLMNSSSITTLLSSATYRQNAIDNLLAQVQAGDADGVCIDFEGVSVSQNANLVTFMTDLTSAFHSAIPGSHVSICTPAVDWSGAFDYDQLAINCDGLFIMAYDYYWSGSTTAGPVCPRAPSTRWGSRAVTWTIDDYLLYGGSENSDKFILGLPYYGYEWPTTSTTVPSSTTGTGSSRTYNVATTNAAIYGRLWEEYGEVPYYIISTGPSQCFYDDAESLGLKWDLVNTSNLGGTGMWALNYDTNDDELWDTLSEKFWSASPSDDMTGIIIGIDPGHGGTDPGAIGPTGLYEKDINLTGSLFLRDALEARGATIYMTRTDDTTLTLADRYNYFNSIPVHRAESYHHNASGNPSANYTGVHIYDNGTGSCPASDNSKDMAAKTALMLDEALDIGVVSSNCSTPIYGVHGDNFAMVHYTSMPAMLTEASFISNPDEEALLYTEARNCLIAGAIAKGIEDHYDKPPQDPPCAAGTCVNPLIINTFPFSENNTTTGRGRSLDDYSCPPEDGSEAGPEVVYLVSLPLAGLLTVTIADETGIDIDPHLLSACDPSSCITRANTSFTVFVQAGDYYLVCDTWTSEGGTEYPGDYALTVDYEADTTSPAEIDSLRWQNARWEWDAVTLDRLGNPETMGYYQMWRATDLVAWNFSLVLDNISETYLEDIANPGAGECWYYFLHAIDAAGNRDNPLTGSSLIWSDAVYSGAWIQGGSPDCLGGSGQYNYVSTASTPTATATWDFEVEESGYYTTAVRFVAGTTNRTTVRYTTNHAQGSDTVLIDQTTNNCIWQTLGTYVFQAGTLYSIVLDNQATTGKVAIAEAVSWQQ